jgi:Zn-dependent membrane protease YugP
MYITLNAMKNSANIESDLSLGITIAGFLVSATAFVYVLITLFQLLAVYTQSAAIPENIERFLP